jgi:hypothetical protein
MIVKLELELDIQFLDEDLGNPADGDPMWHRMRASAMEAVTKELDHAELKGFVHDLGSLTSLAVIGVKLLGDEPQNVPLRKLREILDDVEPQLVIRNGQIYLPNGQKPAFHGFNEGEPVFVVNQNLMRELTDARRLMAAWAS